MPFPSLLASSLLCVALTALVAGCGTGAAPAPPEVAVRVGGVGLDPVTDSPVVLLREERGERTLPIWIGLAEAQSIASEMERVTPPRPNTHDLMKRLLKGVEARVDRVVVTRLQEGIYFAVLVVDDDGRRLEIDARPSDAIALALRSEAPLFVRERLFERSREPASLPDDDSEESLRL